MRNGSSERRPVVECVCGDHFWVETTKGYIALVSPIDRDILAGKSWCCVVMRTKRYARAKINRRAISLHSLVLARCEDREPGSVGDHKNGNGMDCRRRNLRFLSVLDNNRNMRVPYGKVPYKGVWLAGYSGRYQAGIRVDGRSVHLGLFINPIDAAMAYDKAAVEYFGPSAATNADLGLL